MAEIITVLVGGLLLWLLKQSLEWSWLKLASWRKRKKQLRLAKAPTTLSELAKAYTTLSELAKAPTRATSPIAVVEQIPITQWGQILNALNGVRGKFDISALLRVAAERVIVNSMLIVGYRHESNRERLQSELDNPHCRIAIEKAVEDVLGHWLAVVPACVGRELDDEPPSSGNWRTIRYNTMRKGEDT